MKTRISYDLSKFLFRARLCVTLIRPGKPARFEDELFSIIDNGKLPKSCLGLVGMKLSKYADPSFGLLNNRIILFNPQTREWTGYSKKKGDMRKFIVEVIGLVYNYRDYFDPVTWCSGSIWHDNPVSFKYDHHLEMDRFGIAISGQNVRTILFKKIYNGLWEDSPYKRSNIQEVKGQNLITLLRNILKDTHEFFTKDEMKVVNMYLYQDSLFNPIV